MSDERKLIKGVRTVRRPHCRTRQHINAVVPLSPIKIIAGNVIHDSVAKPTRDKKKINNKIKLHGQMNYRGGFLGYQSLDGRRKKKRGTVCRSDDDWTDVLNRSLWPKTLDRVTKVSLSFRFEKGWRRGRGRKATLDNLKLDKCLMCGLHDKILSMAKLCGWPDAHLLEQDVISLISCFLELVW